LTGTAISEERTGKDMERIGNITVKKICTFIKIVISGQRFEHGTFKK